MNGKGALLRDDQGYIAEASGACFFNLVRGEIGKKKLITPPSDNALRVYYPKNCYRVGSKIWELRLLEEELVERRHISQMRHF